jgi:hypothetical protein
MTHLINYLQENVQIGLFGEGQGPVDMVFFKAWIVGEITPSELMLMINSQKGYHAPLDLFDGVEHSYLEIGAWIGDQGLALKLMALGTHVGLWVLRTPLTELKGIDLDLALQMAGVGLITVQHTKEKRADNG